MAEGPWVRESPAVREDEWNRGNGGSHHGGCGFIGLEGGARIGSRLAWVDRGSQPGCGTWTSSLTSEPQFPFLQLGTNNEPALPSPGIAGKMGPDVTCRSKVLRVPL